MNGYRDAPPRVLVVAFGKGIRGLDTETGEVRWEVEPGAGRWLLHVTGERIFAAGSRQLVCLAYPSGDQLWSVSTAMLANALLVDGDQIFVTGFGELECFSADGRRLWHNPFPGKGLAQAALGLPGNVAQADIAG